MLDKLLKIIESEDKKNPLTDEEIAAVLESNREVITDLRIQSNVPNSRDRRKNIIFEDGKKIIKDNRNISERKFLVELSLIGYKISRHVAAQLKKEILDFIKTEENVTQNVEQNVEKVAEKNELLCSDEQKKVGQNIQVKEKDFSSAFSEIIGCNESLKTQIKQAKAAVMYPPSGLHTLILGPSGAGKSQLAEAMYNFAVESERLEKVSPFIILNCADYADNPQLLLSQLFGHVKGAFTGADTSKIGAVEKADGGILFLDEIHRLPKEGQEILFYFLDKGKFNRLGEVANTRSATVMIIAATTETPESALLLTFRRRIPMVIEMPPLNERSYIERFNITEKFFLKEASRIKREILVNMDCLKILMSYDCPGNIGQLRSDIQVACARGLINSMADTKNPVVVTIEELSNHVRQALLKISKRNSQVEQLVSKDLIFYPDISHDYSLKPNRYILSDKIYQFIEKRFQQLKEQGYELDEINMMLDEDVRKELEKFAKNINRNDKISKNELVSIVGDEIICAVEKAFSIAKTSINNLNINFFYSLAIHLSATCERLLNGKEIINPQLNRIKIEYPEIYKVAKKISLEIEKELHLKLPEDEIGFIAMYLKTFSNYTNNKKGKVGVIVLTHGYVASAMVDVANRLLGVHHAVSVEMALDESPESALEKAIEAVKMVDEGKGCLLLVDMGSLITFGEIISQKTGIDTKVVGRVDTVMVLEAVRRSTLEESSLEEIAEELDGDKNFVGKVERISNNINILPNVIVTICITGKGTAMKIKKYIEDILPQIKRVIDIIPLGLIAESDLDKEIMKIRERNHIVAFVGAIDPKVLDIPFISVNELLNKTGIKKIENIIGIKRTGKNLLEDVLDEDLIITNLDLPSKNDVLDYLINLLEQKEYVTKEFALGVYKRESISTTYAKGGIAIPHGFPENVTKSAIIIAKLTSPIIWDNNRLVDLIFLIAYKTDSKEYFKNLYKIMVNEKALNLIKGSGNSMEIKEIILTQTS